MKQKIIMLLCVIVLWSSYEIAMETVPAERSEKHRLTVLGLELIAYVQHQTNDDFDLQLGTLTRYVGMHSNLDATYLQENSKRRGKEKDRKSDEDVAQEYRESIESSLDALLAYFYKTSDQRFKGYGLAMQQGENGIIVKERKKRKKKNKLSPQDIIKQTNNILSERREMNPLIMGREGLDREGIAKLAQSYDAKIEKTRKSLVNSKGKERQY